jgi:hypothetical protein
VIGPDKESRPAIVEQGIQRTMSLQPSFVPKMHSRLLQVELATHMWSASQVRGPPVALGLVGAGIPGSPSASRQPDHGNLVQRPPTPKKEDKKDIIKKDTGQKFKKMGPNPGLNRGPLAF